VDASLDHLLSIFSLRTLADGMFDLLADLLSNLILMIEADTLVKRDGDLILILQVIVHSLVFESVFLHFVKACVLLGSLGLGVQLLLQPGQGVGELFPRDPAVLVDIELLHEH
jgi:hypothetical protein